jgi:hypothetical protein
MSDEQNITALINSDHANEADLRNLGRIAEADQMKATRDARIAEWRTAAGIPPPAAPDAAADKAAEFDVNLHAKPGDYSSADLRVFSEGKDDARVASTKAELSALMSAMQIGAQSGAFLMQHISEEGPRTAAMTPEARAMWISDQERLLASSAQIRGVTVEALKATAKGLLEKHPLGATLAASALMSSPTVLLTLFDHHKAVQAWKETS